MVVDGGNGMAGPMVGPLLEGLGLDLIETYWTPDGNFPDHEPNPLLPENRRFVIEKVRESGADLGIAWDGDADRCFFIDDTGGFVDGDFLTALLAESLLEQAPGPERRRWDRRGDPLRRARLAERSPIRFRAGWRARPYVNRVGHAFRKHGVRLSLPSWGVEGPLLLPRLLLRRLRARSPALLILEHLSERAHCMTELLEPYREHLLHLRGDQLRGGQPGGQE